MKMKIAVPVTTDNHIDSHFGHCESYCIYTISDNNEITGIRKMQSQQGCGCKSNIASVLASEGVKVMLAGGIGGGAINVLNSNNIEVIRGCSGDADEVVRLFIAGLVKDSGSSCHQHEEHQKNGHACGH